MGFPGGAVDPLQAGDPGQIGPFRLLGRLGEGGMGRVFLGASAGGRKVAVKVVHSHCASDPEFRARFAGEVANARRVGGFHTALAVDAAPDADPPWIATAYIPGPSLAEAIACRGPLGEAGVRELGAALAEGVTAIHACGVIHRDLKPSNVVILAYAATGHGHHGAPSVPARITSILSDPPDLEPLVGGLHDIIGCCLAKNPADRPNPRRPLGLVQPRRTRHHAGTATGQHDRQRARPRSIGDDDSNPAASCRPPSAAAAAHRAC